MKNENHIISTLFLDVGGVLLTDGWDRYSKETASEVFNLSHKNMEELHHLNFETYELGKMTLDQYLDRVVFYRHRNFSKDQFKTFMFEQSHPHTETIELFSYLKKEYGLKIAVISNEGGELNEYRIKKFKLNDFVDFFISSSFVNLRKPDTDIFRLALDIAQVDPSESIFIDNQLIFVKIAEEFGMKGICHSNFESTVSKLHAFGLEAILTDHE